MDEAGYGGGGGGGVGVGGGGGKQSLISPFHEGSSVALGMGRVERHSRTAFSRPGYFLPPTEA